MDNDKIVKKLAKLGLTDWASKSEAKTTDELKQIMFVAEGNIHNIEKSIELNEEITRLKEELKTLMLPIKEAIDAEKTKIKFVIQTLEGRGVEIGV